MEKKIIEKLTKNYATVTTETYVDVDGKAYKVKESRTTYVNSAIERRDLPKLEPRDISEAIMAMWGDEATVSHNSKQTEQNDRASE